MKKLTSDNRLYIIVAMIALLSIVGFLSYKFLFDKLSKPMIVGDFSVPVLRGWQEKEIPAIHMVQYRKAMENTQLVITFSRLRPSQAQVPQTIEELSSYEKESEQRSKALIPQLRAKYGTPVPRPNQEKWQGGEIFADTNGFPSQYTSAFVATNSSWQCRAELL